MELMVILAFVAALASSVLLYAFGRYSYEVADDALRMRVRILRVVLLGWRTVRFPDVKEAKRFRPREDWRWGWDLFGNVFTRKSAIVRLRKRWLGLFPIGVVVTPGNPDAFVVEVNRRAEEARRSRPL
jgi:hypothetical protein